MRPSVCVGSDVASMPNEAAAKFTEEGENGTGLRASKAEVGVSEHNVAKELAAKSKELVIVAPTERQLFIDIDDESSARVFRAHIVLLNSFRPCSWVEAPSPSGKPWRLHITVNLESPITNLERLALQAMLGSDRLHELLSMRSHLAGDPPPTVFFEKLETASPPPPAPLPPFEP